MERLTKRYTKSPGLSPGTLVYTGDARTDQVRIRVLDYDAQRLEEREITSIAEVLPYRDTPTVTWINVDGLFRVDVIQALGNHYGLHPLALEDMVHTGQRPKADDYGSYLFVVLKMIYVRPGEGGGRAEITSEQVSLVLFENTLLTLQEEMEQDVFDPVRERLRAGTGRLRKSGADYLAYALVDSIVDHYFVVLERLGEEVESLEDRLLSNPRPELVRDLHRLRREMVDLRRSVWPLRDVLGVLQRRESKLIRPETEIFLRDVYDHTVQVIELIESLRDILTGLIDMYLSGISNRLNEVMKRLTLVATIFMPLSFVAGVYGMNFQVMPPTQWRFGFPMLLCVLAGIATFMLCYYRRKQWI